MSSRSQQGGENKDDGLTVALVMLGSILVMGLLIWITSSVKIVTFFTPKLEMLSRSWLWMPGEIGQVKYSEVLTSAVQFIRNPKEVSIFDWIAYFNKAIWLPNLIIALALMGWTTWVLLKRQADVKRAFKPQQLAVHLSHVFTGIAPVLHLRKKIAQDKEPYWRRQTFPHEILLNEKVSGKPMITDGLIVMDRVDEYFRGIEMKKTPNGVVPAHQHGGRPVSKTLGRQIVNLLTDRGKNPCYPDRFSPAGKVVYALLCAHAFGGEEGKKDYAKARDQLNNSARGAAHGFCNLTVAQWLYDKYRSNPTARKLFAVHHWEYTYLYELLVQAKRQGKCGHWEMIWLKPMSRIMFYVLNTVGRLTPHTESAAAFSQFIFEKRCAKRGRVPLMKMPDGRMIHSIYIEKASKALSLEWDRWKEGEDDDNLWWMDEKLWSKLNNIHFEPPPPPPTSMQSDTAFDQQMNAQSKADEKRREDESAARVAAAAAADETATW